MLRAFLLAIGVTLLVLGIECVLLDHIHLRPPAPESSAISPSSTIGPPVTPPGWSGSLLLLAGSLVVLGSWRVSPGKRASQPAPPEEEDEEVTDSLAALITARRIPDHSGDGDAGSFFDFDEDDFFDDEESPEID